MEAREIILMLDFYFEHNFEKIVNELKEKSHPEIFDNKEFIKKYKKEKSNLKKKGVKALTILDDNYPDAFKKIFKPPLVIFYTGDLKILKDAIRTKEYDYLIGPNKFNLDTDKLITSKFNIISFGDNKLNLWTDLSPFILRIIPAISNRLICCKKLKDSDVFNMIINYSFVDSNNDIYIVPTLEPSINNDLINNGAYLLDSKDRLK